MPNQLKMMSWNDGKPFWLKHTTGWEEKFAVCERAMKSVGLTLVIKNPCVGPKHEEAQHLKDGERGHVLAVFKRSAEAVSSRVGGSIDEAEIDSDNTSYMEFHRVDHVARE